MKIILFDINSDMVQEWKKVFSAFEKHPIHPVTVMETSVEALLANHTVDSLVSPANSFGFMDGGIDGVYSRLIPDIQTKVQKAIKIDSHGELAVGSALGVETDVGNPFEVICAPTMRVPSLLTNELAINCYLATRAAFALADYIWYKDETIAFPGMGTGVGGLPKDFVAISMLRAYQDVLLYETEFPGTLFHAAERHQSLMNEFRKSYVRNVEV